MEKLTYEYERDRDTEFVFDQQRPREGAECSSHFHRSIEILYVTSGSQYTTVGTQSFVQGEDEIVFVHGYYRHSFGSYENCVKYVIIIPTGYDEDIRNSFKTLSPPPLMADREFNRTVLRPIFEKLHEGCETMPHLVKKGYLNVLIGHILEHYPLSPLETSGNVDMLDNILSYIDSHCDEVLSLDTLSSAFGYNKYYFSRLFNRYVGYNLNNYINVVRLREFMRLYKENNGTSVSALAFQCGFESLSTFYRCFSKLYAGSPKEYLANAK